MVGEDVRSDDGIEVFHDAEGDNDGNGVFTVVEGTVDGILEGDWNENVGNVEGPAEGARVRGCIDSCGEDCEDENGSA